MTISKCIGVLLFLAVLSYNPQRVLYAQRIEPTIDSLVAIDFGDKTGPGGVFMVAKDGKVIYLKAFGKANLEVDANLTTESVFQLGSMTKQFTAIGILMLEEQGKLRVDDAVSTYIPDYPSGGKIIIHHLLTHTSGIKDFTKMKALRDIAQKDMTPRILVDFFKDEPVDFPPGDKFEYNNSGYVLLGYIIELVSGQTFQDFIEKAIFKKIGMRQSSYASDRRVVKTEPMGTTKKRKDTSINRSLILAFLFRQAHLCQRLRICLHGRMR